MLLKRNSNQNKRRRERQLLNTSVQVFTATAHLDALGINLSDFGMCLFTIANMPVGSEIQVEFLPPQCKQRIRVGGTVRYRALYLYGIEFLVDSDQRPERWADVGAVAGPGSSNS